VVKGCGVFMEGSRFWYQERVCGGRLPRRRGDFLVMVGNGLVCDFGLSVAL